MITIDMKMPTDCSSCLIRKIMGCRIANESGWLNNRRDERCPLKELVRCKDCKYADEQMLRISGGLAHKCTKNGATMTLESFCSDGNDK